MDSLRDIAGVRTLCEKITGLQQRENRPQPYAVIRLVERVASGDLQHSFLPRTPLSPSSALSESVSEAVYSQSASRIGRSQSVHRE